VGGGGEEMGGGGEEYGVVAGELAEVPEEDLVGEI
jgi:hypothetical protein